MRGLLALLLVGCASSVPPVTAPPAPSTHRDPPAYVPRPDDTPETGELVGVIASGGEDQARELLVRLVLAIRDGDVELVRALLADEVALPVRSRRIDGARLAEQWVAHARIAHLPPDASFDELIEVDSIHAGPLPAEPVASALRPGDVLVRFRFTELARRAFATMSGPDGQASLVVRPGEDPRIVAR